jgi:glycosyltransferase involved in cell wall biosynthesis
LSYWVVIVTRNGAQHLTRTLDSVLNQTEEPKLVTVVDDGSTDNTQTLLGRYERLNQNLTTVTRPDRGYDIRRVPDNINLAWKRNADLASEYFMISGDDCVYPPAYAGLLLTRMNSMARTVVASGRPSIGGGHSQEHSPSGSGRMVRCSFWREVGGRYPLKAGWETWLLYKAAEGGFEVRLFDDLTYEHARPRGAGHQFMYWGAAMGTLGYHPLYAMGRITINAVKPSFAPRRAVKMLRGYLQAQLGSSDAFIAPYDQSLQSFVKRKQSQRITKVISLGFRTSYAGN